MLNDFETKARHEKHLNKIKKRWASQGKKYKETIERMKELREQNYLKKSKELKEKLKRKEDLLLTQLDHSNKEKMLERQKILNRLYEKERLARENAKQYQEEEEKERQIFQENLEERCKIIFLIYYFLK
jgi:hypothetical protein